MMLMAGEKRDSLLKLRKSERGGRTVLHNEDTSMAHTTRGIVTVFLLLRSHIYVAQTATKVGATFEIENEQNSCWLCTRPAASKQAIFNDLNTTPPSALRTY